MPNDAQSLPKAFQSHPKTPKVAQSDLQIQPMRPQEDKIAKYFEGGHLGHFLKTPFAQPEGGFMSFLMRQNHTALAKVDRILSSNAYFGGMRFRKKLEYKARKQKYAMLHTFCEMLFSQK